MKYVLLIGDGMADRPLDLLGGKTPLQVSKTPNMDEIAAQGVLGLIKTVSRKIGKSSDVAILSILGYDPRKYYTGRGPLEAASMGVHLEKEQIAFRCNLVTADEGSLVDYSAGHISTKEAEVLIAFLNKNLKWDGIKFYPGVSYRHLAVVDLSESIFSEFDPRLLKCKAPHDVVNQPLEKILPSGTGNDIFRKLTYESKRLLDEHEINVVRRELGENPANMAWLWGQGKEPSLPDFGISGAVISAVDVVKGIGVSCGLSVVDVPGATGYFDTDYNAKAEYAISSLKEYDFVLVHVEAPDEAGHIGDVRAKISAIEDFDEKVVGPILSYIRKQKDYRVCVLPDHATPIDVKTHVEDMVPFAIYGKGMNRMSGLPFDEMSAKQSGIVISAGHELMGHFLSAEFGKWNAE